MTAYTANFLAAIDEAIQALPTELLLLYVFFILLIGMTMMSGGSFVIASFAVTDYLKKHTDYPEAICFCLGMLYTYHICFAWIYYPAVLIAGLFYKARKKWRNRHEH